MCSRRAAVLALAILFAMYQPSQGQGKTANRPELVPQLGHANALTAVAFTPDGKYALTGSFDKTVRVWEVLTGREVARLEGHTQWIDTIAATPDGKTIISAASDNTIRFWDRATGKQVHKIDGSGQFALSGDGKHMAVGPARGLKFVDPATFKESNTWELFGRRVLCSAFNRDGSRIVVVTILPRKGNETVIDDAAKMALVVDTKTARQLVLKGHSGTIVALAFSPDGKRIVTGSSDSGKNPDNTVRIWDADSGKELHKLVHNERVRAVAFAPDGKTVLSGGEDLTARIWDAESGKQLYLIRHPTWVSAVAYSPDGAYVLTGSYDNTGRIWDAKSGLELGHLTSRGIGVVSLALAPNGKHMLVGAADATARLWDMSEGKELRRFEGHIDRVTTVAFSHDAKSIATGSGDGTARLWDVASGVEMHLFKGHTHGVNSVAFSVDSKIVMTGSADASVRLWSAATGKPLTGAPGPPTGTMVASVAYSPNGQRMAVGRYGVFSSDVPTARLYDAATGKELRQLDVGNAAYAVAFSPDSKRLATVTNDQSGRIWDVETGRELVRLNGHTSDGTSVAFAPDGKTVLTGSGDATARLWDAATGKTIHVLRGHIGAVTAVAYLNAGKLLVTGGSDGTVRLWDAATGKQTCMFMNARQGVAVVTADNYYLASREALATIGFRMAGRAVSFDQVDLRLNRPDLVVERIGLAPAALTEAYHRAYQKRLRRLNFKEETLGDSFQPPEVAVTSERPLVTKEKSLKIKLKASDASFNLDRLEVHVNGVPISGANGIALREKKTKTWEQDLDVPLSTGENRIQVSALNEKAVGAVADTFVVRCDADLPKPALYLVVVGVSDYKDARYRLTYADKDARDLADFWESQRDKFSGGKTVRLLNADATRDNILKVKDVLKDSRVDDLVVVFFAGHGVLDAKLDYYFATADIDFADPAKRGLSYESIEGLLDGIPARKKLLLMDTCHSGELDKDAVVGPVVTKLAEGTVKARGFRGIELVDDPKEMRSSRQLLEDMFADLRRGTGAVVIAASGGGEFALESGEWKNGVFTYALLQGLKAKKADRNKDGRIQVSELRDFVLADVQRLTRGRQTPALRRENLEFDYAMDAGPTPAYRPPLLESLPLPPPLPVN